MSSAVPYDPYDAPAYNDEPASSSAGLNKADPAAIQAQIDDTVGVMRNNINKVAERGERIDAIQDKAENLAVNAQGFRRSANRVRKQMWWKDMKMRICLVIAVICLIVVIVVPIVVHFT